MSFKGVEHRLELCGEVNGVGLLMTHVPIPISIKAIEAIEDKIVLIAGGFDKGSSFDELIDILLKGQSFNIIR